MQIRIFYIGVTSVTSQTSNLESARRIDDSGQRVDVHSPFSILHSSFFVLRSPVHVTC